jgi:hypothetical protein
VLTYTPLDDRGGNVVYVVVAAFSLLYSVAMFLWSSVSWGSWESGWGIGCDMVRMRGRCWSKIHNQHTILVTPSKRPE